MVPFTASRARHTSPGLPACGVPPTLAGMDLGIIGLARSGKTSLFNAVTRGQAQVGAYSSQSEPNVGVARVPDARVDALASVFKPKKTTYAEIRWVDYPIAGFGSEGPGAQFVSEIAKMDALVQVVRAFEDESVPHPDLTVDPHRDIEALDLELTFVDLGLIERRLTRIEAEMRSIKAAERARLEQDRDLQRKIREFQEDLNQRRNEETAAIVERANKVIKQIAETEKYDLIIQEAVYRSTRIDITEKVIKALAADK